MTLCEDDNDLKKLPFGLSHMEIALGQWLFIGLLIAIFQVFMWYWDDFFTSPGIRDVAFDLIRGTLRPWQVVCWLLVIDIVTPGWGLRDIHEGNVAQAIFYGIVAYCLTLLYG